MSQDPRERRLSPRVTALLKIEYPSMAGFFVDYLIDLSQGGLFIRTKLPLKVGNLIDFTISFPGLLEPIALQGVVRHRTSEDDENPGVGVEFIFSDDETKENVAQLVKQISQDEQELSSQAKPYRILVVDDNERVLELFCFALKRLVLSKDSPKHKPEVITATSGHQAWEILRSQQVDLLILDHYMPEMDGMSLLRLIRADEGLKNLPVVMISTDKEQLKLSSLRTGANLFVAKPVRALTLLTTLSALISDTKSAQP